MKQLLIPFLLLFSLAGCNLSGPLSPAQLERKNYQEVVGSQLDSRPQPDQYAMYPNGQRGINEHIAKTTRYPRQAMADNIQGKVLLEFIVEKDGSLSHIRILESVSPELDAEALRVIGSLDRFHPGFKDGEPVRILYKQPINFKLR